MKNKQENYVDEAGTEWPTAPKTPTHTPTPFIKGTAIENKMQEYFNKSLPEIVRAVNAHEELVKASKDALAMIQYYREAVIKGQIVGTHPGALCSNDYDIRNNLEQAIARAEGGLI
jgi:hypothetical protein